MTDSRNDAARWFAVLRRGLMTYEECVAYDVWRREPANAAAMDELGDLWNALGASGSRDVGPSRPGSVVERPRIPGSLRAGIMFGAACLAFGLVMRLDSPWLDSLDWWSR